MSTSHTDDDASAGGELANATATVACVLAKCNLDSEAWSSLGHEQGREAGAASLPQVVGRIGRRRPLISLVQCARPPVQFAATRAVKQQQQQQQSKWKRNVFGTTGAANVGGSRRTSTTSLFVCPPQSSPVAVRSKPTCGRRKHRKLSADGHGGGAIIRMQTPRVSASKTTASLASSSSAVVSCSFVASRWKFAAAATGETHQQQTLGASEKSGRDYYNGSERASERARENHCERERERRLTTTTHDGF